MSHKATNWAVGQRGLKPAARIVLWHLADRHNKDTGRCDPSQELLAHDCEMSRATINRHLETLEQKGFIRRIQRVNKRTGKQENTQYVLGFDFDRTASQNETRTESQKDAEPCLKNDESRVSNCDTNPVRVTGNEPSRATDARESALHHFEEFWQVYPRASDRTGAERAYLAAIKAGADPSHLLMGARAYAATTENTPPLYVANAKYWLRDERWKDHEATPAPEKATDDEVAAYWADIVNSGRPVFADALKPHIARHMLDMGLVTRERLDAAGVRA